MVNLLYALLPIEEELREYETKPVEVKVIWFRIWTIQYLLHQVSAIDKYIHQTPDNQLLNATNLILHSLLEKEVTDAHELHNYLVTFRTQLPLMFDRFGYTSPISYD